MSQLDEPLTVLARIPPVYPIRARRRGIEGTVTVTFEVDEQGNVANLRIVEAVPPNIFEKSVLQCVSRWRYKPGTIEGVAVRARVETTIRFNME
jgi:protein TonB